MPTEADAGIEGSVLVVAAQDHFVATGLAGQFDQIADGNLSTSSRNFVTLAKLVATAALWREESRGGHFRSDFPDPHEEWRVHSVQRLGEDIFSAPQMNFDTARAV